MPKKDGTPTKPELDKARKAKDKAYKAKKKAAGKKLDKDGRFLTKSPYLDKPMNDFWQAVDKEEMLEAVKQENDPKMDALISYLVGRKNPSMSRACRECDISLQKLNELWQKHQLTLGHIMVSNRIPKIMADAAHDAESKYELCDRCDGLGTISRATLVEDEAVKVDEPCPKCKGEREVRVPGDAESRKQIFELTGLTGKTGPLVAIQQNTIIEGTLDDTLSMAQKILTGKKDVIDVTPEDSGG